MNNIGLIGLGVMGQNLVLNMSDHGFSVSVFNRTYEVTKNFIIKNTSTDNSTNIFGFEDVKSFILSLERPRKIIFLVKAGDVVDDVIKELLPYSDSGDIIIDSGNSFYKDTLRREIFLQEKNIKYIGLGISGGEEGARHGPSFMAGGNKDAYNQISHILKAISAKDFQGEDCVSYFGDGGAGHFVKMIHNGIEYVDMQLLADVYILLKNSNKNNSQIANVIHEFNSGRSGSYLVEITEKVLLKKDEDGSYLLDKILDVTSQKGTGQWASVTALEMGIPSFSFANSVFSRFMSSQKDTRLKMSKIYSKNSECISIAPTYIEKAYYCAKIISYAQGLEIIKKASDDNNWNINLSECARIWQGGCIIRAKLLSELYNIFNNNVQIENILEDNSISNVINSEISFLKDITAEAIKNSLFIPGMTSVLEYFESLTNSSLSANLTAALRDVFGDHGYKRNDKTGDFHTEW